MQIKTNEKEIRVIIDLCDGYIEVAIAKNVLLALWQQIDKKISNFSWSRIKQTAIYKEIISKIDYLKLVNKLITLLDGDNDKNQNM